MINDDADDDDACVLYGVTDTSFCQQQLPPPCCRYTCFRNVTSLAYAC